MESEQPAAYVPPVVDESRDIDLWWGDLVLGMLTLPLLFWALMYAVTGGEKMVATRAARLKMYGVLLVIEAIIIAGIVYVVVR